MRLLSPLFHRIAVVVAVILLAAFSASAQDAIGERNIGASSPRTTGARQDYGPGMSAEPAPYERPATISPYARPAAAPRYAPPIAPAPYVRHIQAAPAPRTLGENPSPYDPYAAAPAPTEERSAATPPAKPHRFFPYTVKPGDSLGTISQFFGVPVADLAHVNKIHEDTELNVDDILKIPNPFEASEKNLESQVDQLSEQTRAIQQKLQQAEAQVLSLSSTNSELTADNISLKDSVKAMPWWRGTALAVGTAALLLLGVTALTFFEWWMLRRRFKALSDLSMSLSHLDVKYKETIAKAELRMQQLYGRRRPAGAPDNLLGGARTPDEVEIDRLSQELKTTLERHLKELGLLSRRTIGTRLRGLVTSAEEEEPTPEPRPYRR
jgi:LysM repeat protein